MPKGVHKLTCTATHIGLDVPDELAWPALLQRLVSRSKRTKNGCLEWTGWCTAPGYGSTAFHDATIPPHRLVAILAVIGPIPDGMQVLHSCDNPPCMNPRHLSLGSGQENMQQAVERGRHYEAEKTHCDRGHELAGENVRHENGRRHCNVCARARHRINAGWPEDLAYSVPKGQMPAGLKRGKPPIRRKHGSSHCTKGHELSGGNRYVTPKKQIECRKCRQIARDGYAAKQLAKRASERDRGADDA